ncbi:hypothetical protein [Azonexus sp. IMCC34839]|uniref:hypothetical protein n=1 Tax=Azonexus sp. IMCC34839 TaxID=3133695 RepID=UPI00399B4E89
MATAQIVAISSQKRTRIINRYLELAQQMAKLKTELEMLKVEAIELLGEGNHESNSARVSINWTSRTGLDTAKAKTFLTAAQQAECSKTTSYYDVRVKAL